MKSRSKEFLDRAVAAMLAAIEIYNKPDFRYRAESFTILSANAWELILKAKWVVDHNNQISALYVRQGGGTKLKHIKKTAAGNPMTFSLDFLANKLRETAILNEQVYRNLRILSEFRDSAVHFYHKRSQFVERLQEVGAATVKNFHAISREWFKEDLSRYNFYIMPLAFVSPPSRSDSIVLTTEEKRFLKFVNSETALDNDPAARYSVAVNVELRFVKSKASDAISVRVTNDATATAVRLTEEQMRDKYPWNYQELTMKCRERYPDFKLDAKYHEVRKSLELNNKYAHIRRLDPVNPKSPKKVFYNANIFIELDKQYMRS